MKKGITSQGHISIITT